MPYQIRYACFSSRGKLRGNHEDNYVVNGACLPMVSSGTDRILSGSVDSGSLPLFGVFDGMGGESAGEAASYTAARTAQRMERSRQNRSASFDDNRFYLEQVFHRMDESVCTYAKDHRIRSMGTTAACLLFAEGSICCGNVGDSRVYRAGADDAQQITTDQVMQSVFHAKPPLLQYIGMQDSEFALRPEISVLPFRPGDRYLICTDGVSDMVAQDQLLHLLSQKDDPVRILQRLLKHVWDAGARDNATAILCVPE